MTDTPPTVPEVITELRRLIEAATTLPEGDPGRTLVQGQLLKSALALVETLSADNARLRALHEMLRQQYVAPNVAGGVVCRLCGDGSEAGAPEKHLPLCLAAPWVKE